jgi:hypothetical protein
VILDNDPIIAMAVSALAKLGAFCKVVFLNILVFLARFEMIMDDKVNYCNCVYKI